MALLGNGLELIGTPGIVPVALPCVFHHLTTGGERGGEGGKEERGEGKMTNVI